MSDPLSQTPVLNVIVMHQQHIHRRLTHHQFILLTARIHQPHHPPLIRIQLARGALVQRPAYETAKVLGAEPDLGFEEESA